MKPIFLKRRNLLVLGSERSDMIMIILIFGVASFFIIRQNFIDAENLRKNGIPVKAIVYNSQYVKGTYTFDIRFLHKNKIVSNECRSRLSYAIGDSINVRIDSKKPSGACRIIYSKSDSLKL
ncbi:hypothetical protein [Hymenobacter psoromatis]|uniref:hypothetical protein n=1 Tax=Hymenobacter psoromatis TaxID=1484116 RepID=UPI001CBD46ED|nr:hypothetical protein [Hymenobacter psoromatis]